jgi:integrase
MSEFKSLFAGDIEGFISLKEAFGYEWKSGNCRIKRFDKFCTECHPKTNNLTRELAMSWLAAESETSDTKPQASVIRQFGKYLSAIGKTAYVLPDNFVLSKTKFSPYIPTESELTRFFEITDSLKYRKQNPMAYFIAPVLFRLLYTCGLRPNEGRELKTEDINFQTGEILIRQNKQHKERIVVMSDDMLDFCVKYKDKRINFGTDDVFFFPSKGDEPYNSAQLCELCKSCWRKANPGVVKENLPPLRPYDFRHCFASSVIHRWLDEGKNIESLIAYLRAYMGHTTFESTYYYVHLIPERLAESGGIDLSVFENLLPEVDE